MKILIIAATLEEIEPLIQIMDSCEENKYDGLTGKYKDLEISFVITGVGMVVTAIKTFYALYKFDCKAVFNIGLCGSFNKNLEIGTVVNIVEDCFSELGAEDGDEFLTLDELKLDGVTKISMTDSKEQIGNYVLELLPKVNGITVNTVHGNEKSINDVIKRYHPMVESMEGAAFMLVCQKHEILYAQIRAVSNYVERRNKDAWNIPLAIENLNKKVIEILDAF